MGVTCPALVATIPCFLCVTVAVGRLICLQVLARISQRLFDLSLGHLGPRTLTFEAKILPAVPHPDQLSYQNSKRID